MTEPAKTRFDIAIADKVREMRIAKNLTQRYIAEALNLTHGFIGQVESPNSEARYSLNHLNRLAKELECSPKDFLPETYIEELDWID